MKKQNFDMKPIVDLMDKSINKLEGLKSKKNIRPEVGKLYINRTKEDVAKLLEAEGNQKNYQFQEWWDVFQLLSECRKYNLNELYAHCILSNRFELKRKEEI